MRKAIDAHVHILPETMLGRTDSALKTKAEKFGIFVYENRGNLPACATLF